jgi:hypothetical protein
MVRQVTLIAAVAAVIAGMFAVPGLAHNGVQHVPPIDRMPVAQPEQGLVYKGLRIAREGPCVGAYKLGASNRCTHGPDAAPEGVNVKVDVDAIRFLPFAPLPKVQCDGDGISGKRVQVIYARSSDQPNRYGTYVNSIRQWAAESDEIYRDSAAETGGERHIRFVHNSSCVLTVPHVIMSPTGDDSFTNTQVELAAQGYNLTTRKYMIFVDANVYCGIGNIKNDDQPGAANLNNGGPSYGRTDAGCWGGTTPAHELMHNIGGVQLSAPHSSGGWHCTDEWDLECYSDSPYYPTMSYLCPDSSHNRLFDCGHDDYYRVGSVGGYLATHWNSANSQYLVTPKQRVWGYVWANDPLAASYTPSTTYQRNSTGQLNTINRLAVGYYQVVFENLGIYYGGTVDVTAYGAGSENCKVQNWGPTLADQIVYVRCFDAGGGAVDTQFTAAFTRPISSFKFGYVWANNPVAASYTPSTTYQFNSTGAANTITRSGVGTYQVTLPGLGGQGGTIKATAYGPGNEACHVSSWSSLGANAVVNVRCQNPAGGPVDTLYTLTYHATFGLLGTLTGGPRAYVWANLQSSPGYVPSLTYQYNSTGAANTISRSGVGVYQVTLPGLGAVSGHAQVTAYGAGSTRCKVQSWNTSGAAKLVNIRCFDTAGAPADSRYVLDFVH